MSPSVASALSIVLSIIVTVVGIVFFLPPKNKEKFGPLYQDSNHIFTWEDGRPYSPDYVSKQFSRIIHRSEDLDNSITLHTLRVSCVSLLIHDGVDVKDIQRWVGHADIKTTLQIYARTNQKQQNKVAAKMEKFLFSSSEETEI